jgi:AcrR family transcriptional regulator
LRAAGGVFAREGFAAASVTRIAEAAGVTKPTLYARFGSKAELFEATIAFHAAAIQRELFAAYDQALELPLDDGIRAGVDAWFDYARAHPDGMTLLFGEHPGAHSPVARRTTEALVQRIAGVVDHHTERGGRPAGDASPVLAAMIVGTAVRAVRRCLADPRLDDQAIATLTSSFLIAALRGVDPQLFATVSSG